MTRAQVRTKLQVLLDEYSDQGGWEIAELDHIIDLASNEVASLFLKIDDSHYLESTPVNVSPILGELYDLPNDFLKVKRMVDSDGVPITRLYKITDRYQYLGYGDIKLYYLQGSKIGFLDVPGTAETLTLLYVRTPEQMDDDADSPDVPEYLGHDLIVYKAAIIALSMDEESNDIINYQAKQLEDDIQELYYTRNVDFPRQQERDEALDDLDI
jgi:hypothetical protein